VCRLSWSASPRRSTPPKRASARSYGRPSRRARFYFGEKVGDEEPISAIITGVPRAGRDDYPDAIARPSAKPLDYFDPKRVH